MDGDWSGTAPTCVGEPNSHSILNTCTSLFLVMQQKIHALTWLLLLMDQSRTTLCPHHPIPDQYTLWLSTAVTWATIFKGTVVGLAKVMGLGVSYQHQHARVRLNTNFLSYVDRSCLDNTTFCHYTVVVTCPDLDKPAKGIISYIGGSINNSTVNTTAIYSCNSGYSLKGEENRICEVDGDWSGTAPTCVGKCLLRTCMHLSFLS